MAKLEIPSIVVQSGSHTPSMDRSSSWSMSGQSTMEDENEDQGACNDAPQAEAPPAPVPAPSTTRSRAKGSMRLLQRCAALKESTSPPPDIASPTSLEFPTPILNHNNNLVPNGNGLSTRPMLKRDNSDQSVEGSVASTLSRGNSQELQYDQQGGSLEQFIMKTVNKNIKDRNFILKLENDLTSFVNDPTREMIKYSLLSSYQRMIVHRVSHYFGLEHNADQTNQGVRVHKGKNTRLPDRKFSEFIRDDNLMSEEPRKSILKRDSASLEEMVFKSPERRNLEAPRRSKSFEEREEEYEKIRRRIFRPEQGRADHCQDMWQEWNGAEQAPSDSMYKLHPNRNAKLTKVESYEGKDTLQANSLRSSVSKSFSFDGYDKNGSNSRVLTKQDSGCSSVSSRVSPSSSGYKSQSQRSDATMSATPSPTATPHLMTQEIPDDDLFHYHCLQLLDQDCELWNGLTIFKLSSQSGALSPEPVSQPDNSQSVMWAITNMSVVPPGSILINPQTGQPFKNEDGTVYRYDPNNPPNLTESNQNTSRVNGAGNQREPLLPPPAAMDPAPNLSQVSSNPPALEPESRIQCRVIEPCQRQHSEPPVSYNHLPPPPAAGPNYQLPTHYGSVGLYSHPHPHQHPTYGVMTGHPADHAITSYNMASIPPGGAYIPLGPGMEGVPQDLCGYLMGLKLGEMSRPEAAHRPVFYCSSVAPAPPHPSTHFTQLSGPGAGMPIYLGGAAPAGPVQPPRYPCSFPPAEQQRQGVDYNHPSLQGFYSNCPTGQVANGASGAVAGAGVTGAGYPASMGVGLVPTQPRAYHHLQTSPTTPQSNGCTLPMYGPIQSCFTHFQPSANPPSHMSLPPLLRPALQLNMCNSPPLQGPRPATIYNNTTRSPVVRAADPQSRYPSATANGPAPAPAPTAMYQFTPYPANARLNDVVLLNSTRPPLVTPASSGRNSTAHIRRARLYEGAPLVRTLFP